MRPSTFLAVLFAIAALVLTSCAGNDAAERKREATIYRDAWGVPHVHGATDADAAFGFAYAQAEDNFEQLEENFLRATGRSAEIFGEAGVLDDWLNASLEIVRVSQQEYAASPPEVRALLDGYAEGLNLYASAREDRRIETFEPWHPLAFIRYIYYQRGFAGAAGVTPERLSAALEALNGRAQEAQLLERKGSGEGSNSWAVSAKKSVSGAPLLFINPHLPFFGPAQVLEGHVISDEGWNFSGYSRFGFPLPYVGLNERLGWASTDNAADLSDLYIEQFENADAPSSYVFDGARREATAFTTEIRVKTDAGFEQRTLNSLKTHHGPIVAAENGALMALKMAKFEEPGWLAQWLAMTKARDLNEFREATGALDMLFGNYLYADRDGHILYVYNAAVPIRDAAYDWSKPVDGSTAATEWRGYHAAQELPQLLDPPDGWLQNSNGSPFLATGEGNPDTADFPAYMVPETDNYRSAASRRILISSEKFSFADWELLAYDTHVLHAEDDIPRLEAAIAALRASEPPRAETLAEPLALLSQWNRRADGNSEAMTLYVYWAEARRARGERLSMHPAQWTGWPEDNQRFIQALEEALVRLKADWGDWRKAWGEVNRHQRRQAFNASEESLAIDAGPTWAGSIFTFWGAASATSKTRTGAGGHSYVAIVEFEDRVKAKSIHAFGSSGDPASPHYFDQARLYADHKFKDAWLTLEEVKANAVESYRPGERQ